jgi:hypothetical protein
MPAELCAGRDMSKETTDSTKWFGSTSDSAATGYCKLPFEGCNVHWREVGFPPCFLAGRADQGTERGRISATFLAR